MIFLHSALICEGCGTIVKRLRRCISSAWSFTGPVRFQQSSRTPLSNNTGCKLGPVRSGQQPNSAIRHGSANRRRGYGLLQLVPVGQEGRMEVKHQMLRVREKKSPLSFPQGKFHPFEKTGYNTNITVGLAKTWWLARGLQFSWRVFCCLGEEFAARGSSRTRSRRRGHGLLQGHRPEAHEDLHRPGHHLHRLRGEKKNRGSDWATSASFFLGGGRGFHPKMGGAQKRVDPSEWQSGKPAGPSGGVVWVKVCPQGQTPPTFKPSLHNPKCQLPVVRTTVCTSSWYWPRPKRFKYPTCFELLEHARLHAQTYSNFFSGITGL